jgi:predicted transcriptional regulator
MSTAASPQNSLALLLGPRQADIMRCIWSHGSATVRQLQQWLSEHNLAYNTIATLCIRLVEKGLLRRQGWGEAPHDDRTIVYVYTPLISEADFVRAAVTQQLADLLAGYPELRSCLAHDLQYAADSTYAASASQQGSDEHALVECASTVASLHSVAALLERAGAAERQTIAWEAKARHAQQEAKLASAHAERAEARAVECEAAARRATALAQAAEEESQAILQLVMLQHAVTRAAPEAPNTAGVCRVCRQPIPNLPVRRRNRTAR